MLTPWTGGEAATSVVVAVLAVGAATAACGGGDSWDLVDVHPNADNEPPASAASIAPDGLPEGLDDESLRRWRVVRDAFLEAGAELEIGSGERGPDLLGYVPMADVDADGNVVLLDELAQEVRIFDSQGTFVESFGGRGEGPMELRDAHTLALLPEGRVAVPLGRTGPIKVFLRGADRWDLERTVNLTPTPAAALCAFDDGRMFSTGFQPGDDYGLVVQLADPIRTMGAVYRHPERFIARALSGALIDCVHASEGIAVGFEIQPVLRSYGMDGSLRWTAVMSDYAQLEVAEYREPATGRQSYSEEVHKDHDRLLFLAGTASGEHLLAQYGRFVPGARNIEVRSCLIDAATGFGACFGDALPHVLSIQEDGYIALFEGPEVRIEVRKFPRTSGA